MVSGPGTIPGPGGTGGEAMRIAGGILAIVMGLVALFPAGLTTLFAGGLSVGGVFFSVVTVIAGIIVLCTEDRMSGWLVIAFAVLGAVTGGPFVWWFMAVALVGGLLVITAPERSKRPD